MNFTQRQNIQIVSALVFLTAITQVVYTVLYMQANHIPRQWLWGFEGLVFVLLAAFAGSALVHFKQYSLGFSAIFASAILNIVQVGIGLTQFGPFREASQAVEGVAPTAGAVVALSFFIYNAAKVLLGLAAIGFGSVIANNGAKLIGRLTMLAGLIAFAANTIVMMFGRINSVPSGATGVIATLLLSVCIWKLLADD